MESILAFLGSDTTKIAVTVISTAVGIFLTIAKVKSLLPRPRLFLKEDIEILTNLGNLDKNSKEYAIVLDYVKNRIHSIYSGTETGGFLSQPNKSFPFLSAIMILSGIYLTFLVHESDEWSSWWYVGTVYLAVLGASLIFIRSTEGNLEAVKNRLNEGAENRSADGSENRLDEGSESS